MSSFFEPPPQPPEPSERPVRPPRRPWHGAPDSVMGQTVALNLVLGRSEKAVLWISAATVYTDGFEFDVQIRHRLDEELFDPFFCTSRGVGAGRRRRKASIRASSGSESSSRMGARQRTSRAGCNSGENQTSRRTGRSSFLAEVEEAAAGVGTKAFGFGRCRRKARSRSSASGRWLTSPRQEARSARHSCARPQPGRSPSGPKPRAEAAPAARRLSK